MHFYELGPDTLSCIADYLLSKDLISLSQVNRQLYYGLCDVFWKRKCRLDYGLKYGDPQQTYRSLYIYCTLRNKIDRLPCVHLNDTTTRTLNAIQQNKCGRCELSETEALFICTDCHQELCDRHSRHHARLIGHQVYYKPNMSEFFCQKCFDWIGSEGSHFSEIYYVSSLSSIWLQRVTVNEITRDQILKMKPIRQKERYIRWKDTPRHILKHGIYFIPSNWKNSWECFVEGWQTCPPGSIDLVDFIKLPDASNRPAMISSVTWNYLSENYDVRGGEITEADLASEGMDQSVLNQLQIWKKRMS